MKGKAMGIIIILYFVDQSVLRRVFHVWGSSALSLSNKKTNENNKNGCVLPKRNDFKWCES